MCDKCYLIYIYIYIYICICVMAIGVAEIKKRRINGTSTVFLGGKGGNKKLNKWAFNAPNMITSLPWFIYIQQLRLFMNKLFSLFALYVHDHELTWLRPSQIQQLEDLGKLVLYVFVYGKTKCALAVFFFWKEMSIKCS